MPRPKNTSVFSRCGARASLRRRFGSANLKRLVRAYRGALVVQGAPSRDHFIMGCESMLLAWQILPPGRERFLLWSGIESLLLEEVSSRQALPEGLAVKVVQATALLLDHPMNSADLMAFAIMVAAERPLRPVSVVKQLRDRWWGRGLPQSVLRVRCDDQGVWDDFHEFDHGLREICKLLARAQPS